MLAALIGDAGPTASSMGLPHPVTGTILAVNDKADALVFRPITRRTPTAATATHPAGGMS